jgi:hypothetical protein
MSAVERMNIISNASRAALGAGYVVLILLPCVLIAFVAQLPKATVVGTFLAYAFALFPTYYLDHWLLGGIGYHSPVIFAILAVIIAVMLWPMLLLSAKPKVWERTGWRRTISGYGAALVACMVVAGWRMTHSWGLFFG